jgi:hypothetical protein
MGIETRAYYYGLKAGIPFALTNAIAQAIDGWRYRSDIEKRREVFEQLNNATALGGFVSRTSGYARVDSGQLPGGAKAVSAANAIIDDRRRHGTWRSRKNNPYYQCERQKDFVDHPEVIDFALSETVLTIASGYYGMVPRLEEIGIWLTPPQKSDHFSSQLFHLDKPECSLLKLFINLDDTTPETGPLTFLPAHFSDAVRRKTNYERVYFHEDGRLADAAVFAHFSPTDCISLAGPAGSGGFVDTSRCFHYGSRARSGDRKMLTIAFTLPHRARKSRTPLFDLVPRRVSLAQRLALSGSALNS